jgi:asparagine synthase (glutamine-hydrolysing)
MCGIAGGIFTANTDQRVHDILRRMNAVQVHRGPDDSDIWMDGATGVGLAHRRLAVIDLSREGRQPMISPSGRYVLVYNGEVYNYEDIRCDLAQSRKDLSWRGHSDTEVILAAIEHWGLVPAVQRFVGMFALAVWDRRERVLSLVRDRIGIKPLYYGLAGRSIIFGSELKALRTHPEFAARIDRQSLQDYLQFAYVPAPRTIYTQAWKLPAGHHLTIALGVDDRPPSLSATEPYWSAETVAIRGQQHPAAISESAAVAQMTDILNEAVRSRMTADVPLGAFLSGGIDSSTIVALMQANSARPIKTFTIGFHENGYDEARHAAAVANHLGTEHTELYASHKAALELIPELPSVYCEPFADPSQIPTLLLSRLTRKSVTVSLSGDGGDELFGGYNRHFIGSRLWPMILRIPLGLRHRLSGWIRSIPPRAWDKLFNFLRRSKFPQRWLIDTPGDRVHKLCLGISAASPEQMYTRWITHWPPTNDALNDGSGADDHPFSAICNALASDFTSQMMLMDLKGYLADDILVKLDRATMAASLEARVPMLDHRVVEAAWQLPLHFKVAGGQGKRILRKILQQYVPVRLIERPKTGFAVPLDSWLRGPLRDWAETLLDRERIKRDGFLDAAPIRRKWREHFTGRRNWQYQLWVVLMFQAWLDREQHSA